MALGLLLLRVCIGATLAAHGSQKLFGWFGGHGLKATGGFFEKALGFRPGHVHAALAGVTEAGGGLLLILGLFTPLAAAAVIGTMIVAGAAAHSGKGFFITSGGYEYTFILAAVAATLAFTGPGAVSFDNLLFGGGLNGIFWGIVAIVVGGFAALVTLSSRHADEPEPPAVDLTEARGADTTAIIESSASAAPAQETDTPTGSSTGTDADARA